jgi:hypothetical protein
MVSSAKLRSPISLRHFILSRLQVSSKMEVISRILYQLHVIIEFGTFPKLQIRFAVVVV